MLYSQQKTDSNSWPFLQLSIHIKNVSHITQIAFKSLQQTYETKECFKDIKLIESQTQPWSLNQVKSNSNEHYIKKCTKPTCACCGYIKEDRKEDIFKTTENLFFEKNDLIYMVIC